VTGHIDDVVKSVAPSSVFLVADRRVADLHGLPLDAPHLLLQAGEACKRIGVWRSILDALVEAGVDRDGLVVACGGGTVVDVAGFAAATYLRGVRWAAIATTLIAQVDAAHGGKTGLDHTHGKNLIGAFHQPVAVLTPPHVLQTLDPVAVRCGLAEIVKHGVIGRADLLDRCGRDDIATLVDDAKQVKLDIVARDPKEAGERRLLNLGHTLGHAVEFASGYRLAHGDAVAVGLRAACRIAEQHTGFADRARVEQTLDRCGLPRTARVEFDTAWTALGHDKKRRGKTLRWVLPHAVEDVRVHDDVPDDLVRTALRTAVATL